jgi:hypothetical protein
MSEEYEICKDLIVQVDEHGEIEQAHVFVDLFQDWEDVTTRIKCSRYWTERIQQKIAEYIDEEHEDD